MARETKAQAPAPKIDKSFSGIGRWGYVREAQRRMTEIEAARPKPRIVIEGNPYLAPATPKIRHTGEVAPIFLGCYG